MENALILQAARFGDLLQTRRLVSSVSQTCAVHLAVDRSLVSLARRLYPDAVIHGLAFHGQPDSDALIHDRKIFAVLKETDFTHIFNCNFSRLTASICRLFRNCQIWGYRPAHASSGGILRSPWARAIFRISAMRAISPLNLGDFWAWFSSHPVPPETVNPAARPGGKGIGIVLAGREARRSLPVDILGTVANTVFGICGEAPIKLLGTTAEQPLARRLMRLFTPRMLAKTSDLTGKTGLVELIDEVSGLDMVITPDTGVMHLAAFLGVPVLAFFLSSALCHETGPYGLGHTIWQAAPPCSPCLESGPCAHNMACLEGLKKPEFLRSLALSLKSRDPLPSLPAGLQCWTTSFDELGLVLRPRGGADAFSTQRAALRRILANYLEIGLSTSIVESGKEYEELLERILPSSEWMLPPWRYC